jgi:hypothetical protein
MPQGRPSEWPVLFEIAVQILRHAETQIGFTPSWSFGGGTALMLQIDHRESDDIDLFLNDPQLLPYLNPETQDIQLERLPDSYSVEGAAVLKLAYEESAKSTSAPPRPLPASIASLALTITRRERRPLPSAPCA